MKDSFNRDITYLRLSITDLCNLKCRYCTTHKQVKVDHLDVLSIEEMTSVVKVCSELGIKKVRITGGEPLLKRGLVELIKKVSEFVEEIGLTTNGVNLKEYAKDLKEAGLKSLNISLDTLNKDDYKYLTFGDINNVLEGIEEAHKLGFKIKINSVLQKGINDNNLDEMLEYCKSVNAKLRFIELMPLKDTEEYFEKYYISTDEMIKKYNLEYLYSEGTAEYYKYKDYEVGFIRPISNKFCKNCNRIRFTSFGDMITCLHSNKSYNLKEYLDNEVLLKEKIKELILSKPEHHNLETGERIDKDMRNIGG